MWLDERMLNSIWYRKHPVRWLLWPVSLCYQLIVRIRRLYLQTFCQQSVNVPIIVVGNLTVGGVGKTPLVIALAAFFLDRGLRVGIVSRGYGATIKQFPHEVLLTDLAQDVGDEPLLLAKKTNCPVVIAPKRMDAVRYLSDKYQSQLIISDDGLQHYGMGRAIEIVVIDGERGFGNGLCLPAGPMREPAKRLNDVDFVVVNGAKKPVKIPNKCVTALPLATSRSLSAGSTDLIRSLDPADKPRDVGSRLGSGQLHKCYQMELIPGELRRVSDDHLTTWSELSTPIAAVAGIGNPDRFFSTLTALNVQFEPYSFPDHHVYERKDFSMREKTVVMTEKDAVKCLSFATDTMYFLPVEAKLSESFWQALLEKKSYEST